MTLFIESILILSGSAATLAVAAPRRAEIRCRARPEAERPSRPIRR